MFMYITHNCHIRDDSLQNRMEQNRERINVLGISTFMGITHNCHIRNDTLWSAKEREKNKCLGNFHVHVYYP